VAPHKRQDIRKAVQSLLKGATGAEERVFTSRETPWKQVELPGIAVYTLEETSEEFNAFPRTLERKLQLAILAVVSFTADLDDKTDEISLAIEKAMDADPCLGLKGTVTDSILTNTGIEVTEEQGRPIGVVRLVYTVTYHTDTVT
jgi:hypothetical protein